jgi:hypothetical protein
MSPILLAMAGSRPWTSRDRTGGPLDDILASVRSWFPSAILTRLIGTHPADDDNVFWVRVGSREVQIDTHEGGLPPFVMEGDEEGPRLETPDYVTARNHIRAFMQAAD